MSDPVHELIPGVKTALARLLLGEAVNVDVLRLGSPWSGFLLRLHDLPVPERLEAIQEFCAQEHIDPTDVREVEMVLHTPNTPEQEISPWPVLDTAGKYGPAWEAVQAIMPQTEADEVAVFLSLLIMFGNMVDRRVYVQGGGQQYTNDFLLLIGTSSKGRKGTAFNAAKQIALQVDPDWVQTRITTGVGSGEALIDLVRDEQPETLIVKDPHTGEDIMENGKKKRVVATRDAGVDDKRLLWYSSEFSRVLTQMDRPGNTTPDLLREAWDGEKMENNTRSRPSVVLNPHISIITCITPYELRSRMKSDDMVNGFANRFLWCMSQRSKLLPEGGGPLELPTSLQRRLRVGVEASSREGKRSFVRTHAARDVWADYYARANEDHSGIYGSLVARAPQHQLRLQVILAMLDGTRGEIHPAHVEAARALWRYCAASARFVFGETSGDKTADLLYSTMIRLYPGGLPMARIHKEIFNNRGTAEDIRRALEMLQSQGLMQSVLTHMTDSGRGRKAEAWVPLKEAHAQDNF